MSVVAFDFATNKMIADTVVTYGSHSSYSLPKVRQHVIGGGGSGVGSVSMMIGAIGVPSLCAPAESYVLAWLERYFAEGGTVAELDGSIVLPHYADIFNDHVTWLSGLTENLSPESKIDFSIMIAVLDLTTSDTSVGIADAILQPHWGVKPLPHLTNVAIGNREVSAVLSSRGSIKDTGIVNFIGNPHNSLVAYSFFGGVENVETHW